LVLLGVVALVLSQTVFKGALTAEDPPTPTALESREGGESEYVPDSDDPEIAPPPPIFTQKPTSNCFIPPEEQSPTSSGTTVRGGALEYTRPSTWDFPWYESERPYMTQVGGYGRQADTDWYSVATIGAVKWDDEEGGYPGTEQASVTLFQCYATTSGMLAALGENPKVTDYRSEATTVDGHEAWITQATYHFEDPEYLEHTSSSIITSIVVETDSGPQALVSDVAADMPEHVQDLDSIIDSLRVVA
jgi:hypothetical protein